ncbi:type IV pilus assembly protein PilM [Natronospora cellulosivora (SeqCode)]
MFLKKKFTTIDIGTDSIKAVKFFKKKNELIVDGFAMKSLPYQSIKDGKIVDEAVVANRLEDISNELNCRNDRIVTSIASNNLIIRNMELPAMDNEEQLAEAIKWESEDHLPFPVDSAVEDFITLDRKGELLEILLVATKKDMLDNLLSVFGRIGIMPAVVNIQPMALMSIIDYQNRIDDTMAVVDIGNAGTRVIIGDSKNIYLSRNLDLGGAEFTKVFMDEHKINYNEAENMKKKKGIQEDDSSEDLDLAMAQIATTGMVESQYIISIANNLADQIARSLDYYSMKYRNKVKKIYLTGGGSRLKRLDEIISDKIGRDLEILNPYNNLRVRDSQGMRDEEFAIAVGLGLSEVLNDEG